MNQGRRRFALLAAASLLSGIAVGETSKRRVGFLTGWNERFFESSRLAFEDQLEQLGWPAARLEVAYACSVGTSVEREPALSKMLAGRPDVLVVAGGVYEDLLLPLKAPPIVVLVFGDPVQQGLAASMSRPGGNITGLVAPEVDENGKLFETVRVAFPRAKRIGILHNVEFVSSFEYERKLAAAVGLEVLPVPARAGNVRPAVQSLVRQKVDAVWASLDAAMSIPEVAQALLDAKLPSFSDVAQYAEAGGLFAYGSGVGMQDACRQLARFVDKILRGAAPASLPFENTAGPQLVLNARTASRLGYRASPEMLLRAQRVIR